MSRAEDTLAFEGKLVDMMLERDKQRQEVAAVGSVALTAANSTEAPVQSSTDPTNEYSSEAKSE